MTSRHSNGYQTSLGLDDRDRVSKSTVDNAHRDAPHELTLCCTATSDKVSTTPEEKEKQPLGFQRSDGIYFFFITNGTDFLN